VQVHGSPARASDDGTVALAAGSYRITAQYTHPSGSPRCAYDAGAISP
jgi:hypothetical protein